MQEIGRIIKERRIYLELKARRIAAFVEISRACLANLECGRRNLQEGEVEKFTEILQLNEEQVAKFTEAFKRNKKQGRPRTRENIQVGIETLGGFIRQRRISLDLPIRKVAALLDIYEDKYRNIELNRQLMNDREVEALAEALNIDKVFLYTQVLSERIYRLVADRPYVDTILKEVQAKLDRRNPSSSN